MNPIENEKRINRVLRISQFISMAMTITVFLYPIMLAETVGAGPKETGPIPLAVKILLVVAALVLLSAKRIACLPLVSGLKRFRAGGDLGTILSAWLLAVVVGQGMRQFAATLGLAMSLITGNSQWAMLCGLASFFFMIANWPRRSELALLLKK